MDWLNACRVAAQRPVLEYLRFIDGLPELSPDDAEALLARVDYDGDMMGSGRRSWLGPALARLVPPACWSAFLHGGPESYALGEVLFNGLGDRLLPWLLADLPARGTPGLRRLQEWIERGGVPPLLAAAWPEILDLARHDDPHVRSHAARLAARGGQVSPAVLAVLEEELARTAELDDSCYDELVGGEMLLRDIALGGPALRALAPGVEKVLSSRCSALRTGAAWAAGVLGDRSLVPALERAERRTPASETEEQYERASLRYALWQLGGDDAWFARAVADATAGLVATYRLANAFETTTVDGRFLWTLASIALEEEWSLIVHDRFAAIGPRAAEAVASVGDRARQAGEDGLGITHDRARWLTGLDSAETFAARCEPRSAHGLEVWEPYLATNLDTPQWRQTIRRAIAESVTNPGIGAVPHALAGAPQIGVRFLPELVAHGFDGTVEWLHAALPSTTFWGSIGR